MTRSKICWLLLNICFFLSSAQHVLSQSTQLEARSIKERIDGERNKLFNGSFTVFGNSKQTSYESPDKEYGGTLRGEMIFDIASESFFIDRLETVGELNTKVRSLYASSEGSAYYYDNQSNPKQSLFIDLTDKETKAPIPGSFCYVDVRKLGFSPRENLFCGSPEGSDRFFGPNPNVEVTQEIQIVVESENILKLVFKSTFETNTLWINKKEGYTPIRCLSKAHAGDGYSEIKTKWIQIGDVWVPKLMHMSALTLYIPPNVEPKEENIAKSKFAVNLEFSWDYANDKSRDLVLDYKTFDLPNETMVFDQRSGLQEFVHIFGRQMPARLLPLPAKFPK